MEAPVAADLSEWPLELRRFAAGVLVSQSLGRARASRALIMRLISDEGSSIRGTVVQTSDDVLYRMDLTGRHSSGRSLSASILIGRPYVPDHGKTHQCDYVLDVDGRFEDSAPGGNAIQALEHCLFKIRVILTHRYSEYEFQDEQGNKLFLDYGRLDGPDG